MIIEGQIQGQLSLDDVDMLSELKWTKWDHGAPQNGCQPSQDTKGHAPGLFSAIPAENQNKSENQENSEKNPNWTLYKPLTRWKGGETEKKKRKKKILALQHTHTCQKKREKGENTHSCNTHTISRSRKEGRDQIGEEIALARCKLKFIQWNRKFELSVMFLLLFSSFFV